MQLAFCRFLHGGEPKEFLRLLLRARPGARSVLDRRRLLVVLVIVQALMRNELEDEVRNVNLGIKARQSTVLEVKLQR